MALLISSNICFVLGLLLVMGFINKLSEKIVLDVKRKIIIILVSLLIVNYIYYFDYYSGGEDILFLLNNLIFLGTILLMIISLGLAIFKKKKAYLKFTLLGILFLPVPLLIITIMLLKAMPNG